MEDLTPQMNNTGSCWTVIICPEAGGRPTKQGLYDENVLWKMPEVAFLGETFKKLKANYAPEQCLFTFAYGSLRRKLKTAAEMLHLLEFVLYQLRHSAASWEYLMRKTELTSIMRMGRWASLSSLRRYGKTRMVMNESHPAKCIPNIDRGCRNLARAYSFEK